MGSTLSDGGFGLAVVEGAVIGDVAERVDVRVAVVVIVGAHIVLIEMGSVGGSRCGPERGHVVIGRVRVVLG